MITTTGVDNTQPRSSSTPPSGNEQLRALLSSAVPVRSRTPTNGSQSMDLGAMAAGPRSSTLSEMGREMQAEYEQRSQTAES